MAGKRARAKTLRKLGLGRKAARAVATAHNAAIATGASRKRARKIAATVASSQVIARPASSKQPAARPASPSRTPGPGASSSRGTKSGRTYGNPPNFTPNKSALSSEQALMLGADAELQAIYLQQTNSGERTLADVPAAPPFKAARKQAIKRLAALGVSAEECAVMLSADTPAELQTMWLAQMVGGQRVPENAPQRSRKKAAPLGMDDDRFQLHQRAMGEAARALAADPQLGEGEAYSRAVNRLADRDSNLWML
jgi:hypothetical protein